MSECIANNWSARELEKEIELLEREKLLNNNNDNK